MKTVGAVLELDFEVKVVRGAGAMPATVWFADLVTKPTVVSVYMRNNTGSCDQQNVSLAAQAAAIADLGYGLIGLSRDTVGSHQKYAAKHGMGYPLVSDPTDAFATAADAVVEKSMYGKAFRGPLRSAWVLAPDGTIWAIIDRVEAKAHGEQVLAVLRDLSGRR
jgi:thioredoxin-dependent peroxiredoxin